LLPPVPCFACLLSFVLLLVACCCGLPFMAAVPFLIYAKSCFLASP
jgi:hypothetical protein